MLSYGQEAPLTTRPSSRQHALSRYYIPGPPKQVSLLCTAQAGIGLLSSIQSSMPRVSNLNNPGPAAVAASIFRQRFQAQLQPDQEFSDFRMVGCFHLKTQYQTCTRLQSFKCDSLLPCGRVHDRTISKARDNPLVVILQDNERMPVAHPSSDDKPEY